ncbi:ETEC_3214 domain-containing protein [Paenibacillus sp. NPDC057934]|uniref:ETEC_3214 domain-containing protein n=1 Tax=Paenibacillus sp. NPDC057934 TaxID=3346282 RepID=UPI0036DC6319
MKNKLSAFLKDKYDDYMKIFQLIATIITIIGWIIVACTFGKDLVPGKALRDFSENVSDLRLGQNYVFIEKKLGIPTVIEDIDYTTLDNKDMKGSVATYYDKNYVVLTYFDKNKSLFGYVVISDSKYFTPRIPSTLNTKKSGQQKLKNLRLKAVNPSNYSFKSWDKFLVDQYIFARSGGPDLEKYYVEIYDMLNEGYLGLAITDINRDSDSMNSTFARLSEITNPDDTNEFYRKYKKHFDFTSFHAKSSGTENIVQEDVYEKTRIDNTKINSYFLFSTISEINTKNFIEKHLNSKYFTSKQSILQYK